MTTETSCPNCGAALPPVIAHARAVSCDFCGTSVVLEDDAVRAAGEAGVMLDAPELIRVGEAVRLADRGTFEAVGHVRYDYGRGHWDEYFGLLDGTPAWVSVDEGDVALQWPVEDPPRDAAQLFRRGAKTVWRGDPYAVTEVETATLIGFRGQLPEAVAVGETHLYANLSGPGGLILSGERWDGGTAWFAGLWIDPFRVTR